MGEGMTGEQIQRVLQEAEVFVARTPYPYYADSWTRWAEECPAEARAVFSAIRSNTPGSRFATGEHDPARPTLGDLSEDLRQLLDTVCWRLWEREVLPRQRFG